GTWAASPPRRAGGAGSRAERRCWGSARCSRCPPSHSPPVEFAALTRAVDAQRTLLPHGVGALEDPVLPGRETAEDLALERLRPPKAARGPHARQGIGREGPRRLDADGALALPVDVGGGEGDEPHLPRLSRLEILAETLLEREGTIRIIEEAAGQPRESV